MNMYIQNYSSIIKLIHKYQNNNYLFIKYTTDKSIFIINYLVININ